MKDILDDFLESATIDASMWMLHEISNRNGANWDWDSGEGTEIRFSEEDSPQVVGILQDMMRAKRRLGKSVKKDKKLYDKAMIMLRKYFVTQPIEQQIKILKFVQP